MGTTATKRWTADEDMTILSMWEEGANILDIARSVGKSYGAVQTRIHRKGCGKQVGSNTIKRQRWTVEENDQIVAMRRLGKPYHEIASALGRTEVALMSQAMRLGITTDPKTALPTKTLPRDSKPSKGNISRYDRQGRENSRQAGQKAIRPCITCKEPFMSEWIGNRMCQPCKNRTEEYGDG
ncbi:hypothetical protein [Shinella zoogloeoides]|uniref:hypothetical protein n=1 Tax=Shinella zoogloeoides TaxID=352475 RepID=UPI0028A71746|nr:hypothetical protein [Shinella zoogloeoides]